MSEEKDIFIGPDGLEYCQDCKTARELRLPNRIMGEDFKVHVMCACQKEAYEKAEQERKEREFNEMVSKNKSICFHEPRMKEWTFENDDGSVPAMERANQFVDSWDEVVRVHAGLLLWGGVGTGKTYMAACIANALLDQGKRVYMTDFAAISNLSVFDAEDYVRALASYDLLIIDDLGAERDSEFAIQNVFNVINRRWESGKPLIVTTNLTLDEIKHQKNISIERIYDRILDMCTFVKVDGPSKRLESAEKKKSLFSRIFGVKDAVSGRE